MKEIHAHYIRIAAQAALCVAVAVVVLVGGRTMLTPNTSVSEPTSSAPQLSVNPASLEAQAAIVYDPVAKQILFSKNAQQQFALASLTKIMSADTALEFLSPTSSVRITPDAIKGGDYSGLQVGEVWKAAPLLKYTLLVSANDGMAAVAQSVGTDTFLQKMNDTAKELGLAQSYFLNPTGLDLTNGTSGAYGSARDVAVLTANFYEEHPEYLESTVDLNQPLGQATDEMKSHATTKPLLDIPGLIGAKTGYTDLAGGNLVVVFDVSIGHPLVAVVLHSTEEGRYSDVRTLINAARAASLK